ncbi:hypothetical protein [Nocardia sp. XZ_19_369]|uniref:hypothetical protein n=1 Tax=Nocardia sp. XZ_19_369 TaxID=2769487 RepID=UPI00188FB467|nr:hypothetical protein [Nocardia sp. XZ_19_369]
MTPGASTAAGNAEGASAANPEAGLVRPVVALVVGLAVLIAAFAVLNRIPGWADQYGVIWVYLGYFVVMSIAGRLFWQGADKLVERIRSAPGSGR